MCQAEARQRESNSPFQHPSEIAGLAVVPPPEVIAQLARDAKTVLANIQAKKAAGEKLPPDTDNLASAIQYTLEHGHVTGLRQLLESATIIEHFR